MPVRIRNLTSKPVLVPLSSGTTLRLSPGQSSGELHDVEIKENAQVDKLKGQRVIAVESTEGTPPASRKAPTPESAKEEAGEDEADSEGRSRPKKRPATG